MSRILRYIFVLFRLYIFSLLFSIFLGCQKEDRGEDIKEDIKISTDVVETKSGAGSYINGSNTIKASGNAFTVYLKKYESQTSNTNGQYVFDDGTSPKKVITYQNNKWSYSPLAKWDKWQRHRFRAIYPSYIPGTQTPIEESNSTIDLINVNYRITDSYDLLVGYVERTPNNDPLGVSTVNLQFKHALSALEFQIKYKEGAGFEGKSNSVTECALSHLHIAGHMLYGAYDEVDNGSNNEDIYWLIQGTFTNAKCYNWSGDAPYSNTSSGVTENVARVFDGDHVIFVVPQSFTQSENSCKFHFKTAMSGEDETVVSLPSSQWEAGKKYIYTVVISGEGLADINVEIKPWEYIQSNIDICI